MTGMRRVCFGPLISTAEHRRNVVQKRRNLDAKYSSSSAAVLACARTILLNYGSLEVFWILQSICNFGVWDLWWRAQQ